MQRRRKKNEKKQNVLFNNNICSDVTWKLFPIAIDAHKRFNANQPLYVCFAF